MGGCVVSLLCVYGKNSEDARPTLFKSFSGQTGVFQVTWTLARRMDLEKEFSQKVIMDFSVDWVTKEQEKEAEDERKRELERRRPTFCRFDEKNLERVSKWLKCVSCDNVVHPKKNGTTMCALGHLLCDLCKTSAGFCPFETRGVVCNQSIKDGSLIDVHDKLVKLIHPCKYNGCNVLGHNFDENHEEFCVHNPCFQCFLSCGVSGLTQKRLLTHIIEEHDASIRDKSSSKLFSIDFPSDNPVGKFAPVVIKSFDLYFALLMEIRNGDGNDGDIYFWIYLLNHWTDPQQFTANCKIKTIGTDSFINWTETPKPLSKSSDEIISEGQVGQALKLFLFKRLFLATGPKCQFSTEISIGKKEVIP